MAKALDLVGQRWALPLVRELLPGPRRFTDLLLPGLTPNVLAERLRQLEADGLVTRVDLPPPAARQAWALTEAGRRLEPVILALGAFGAPYLGAPTDEARSGRWLVVSLQRRYRGGLDGHVVGLAIDDVPYHLVLTDGRLVARDGDAPTAQASIRGSLERVAAAFAGHPEAVEVSGDRSLVDRLLAAVG